MSCSVVLPQPRRTDKPGGHLHSWALRPGCFLRLGSARMREDLSRNVAAECASCYQRCRKSRLQLNFGTQQREIRTDFRPYRGNVNVSFSLSHVLSLFLPFPLICFSFGCFIVLYLVCNGVVFPLAFALDSPFSSIALSSVISLSLCFLCCSVSLVLLFPSIQRRFCLCFSFFHSQRIHFSFCHAYAAFFLRSHK